jgi:hypothetical protein
VASGPLPNAGSRENWLITQGNVIATSVAQAAEASSDAAMANERSISPVTSSAIGKIATERSTPTTMPVRSSSRNMRRTATPTERPRITSVSVWVPTASAM